MNKKVCLQSCVYSDVGKVRANNEDNYLLINKYNKNKENNSSDFVCVDEFNNNWYALGIFDGMGGGEKGEEAALIAVEELTKQMQQMNSINDLDENIPIHQISKIIVEVVRRANNRIISEQGEKNCGTTGTIIITEGEVFRVFHIGDSRAYLFRDSKLYMLTSDQTLAEMKVYAGIYSRDDKNYEKDKHQLTEYIGGDNTKESITPIISKWLDFYAGDKIMMCTDGVYDSCSEEELISLLMNDKKDKIAEMIVSQAISNGSDDNCTCIVLEKRGVENNE